MTLSKAVIFDADGVIAPIGGTTLWGDDTIAGHVAGRPVHVSPTMCEAIDRLAGFHGATCFWLTDWTAEMRAGLDPFPGRDWPSIAETPDGPSVSREWAGDLWTVIPWWKWWAFDRWLAPQPDLRRLVWVDDDSRCYSTRATEAGPSRRAWTIETALHEAGIDATLIAPDRGQGLRPLDVQIIQDVLHGGM
jgi:hypothetical protein